MSDVKYVYLNGSYIPDCEAKISPFDMGFMFGTSVYEVIYFYERQLFTMDLHMNRLFKSSEFTGIKINMDRKELESVCKKLIEMNASWISNGILYIQISFGGKVGYRSNILPAKDKSILPTIFMFVQSIPESPFIEGGVMKTVKDKRWKSCHIKGCSLFANVMAALSQVDCHEPLLYDPEENNLVLEGASSNLFCVSKGEIYTYPIQNNGDRILHGVTRHVVLHELAPKCGLKVNEQSFSLSFLMEAEEVFITSTTKEVFPIRQIDEKQWNCPGPVTLKLMKAFIEKVEQDCPNLVSHSRRKAHALLN